MQMYSEPSIFVLPFGSFKMFYFTPVVKCTDRLLIKPTCFPSVTSRAMIASKCFLKAILDLGGGGEEHIWDYAPINGTDETTVGKILYISIRL